MAKRKSRKQKQAAEPVKEQPATTQSPGETLPGVMRRVCLAGMLVLLVTSHLFPCDSVSVQLGYGVVQAMAWLVLLFMWLMASLSVERFELRFGLTDALVILFLLLHSLSAVAVAAFPDHASARPAFNVMWQWISFGAVFFLARQMFSSGLFCRALISVMISTAVCLAVLGYCEYFISKPRIRAAFERATETQRREMMGEQYAAPGTQQRKYFEDRLRDVEPIATFSLTNSLAGFLAPWLVISVGVGLTAWGSGRLRSKTLVAAAGSAVVLLGCLFLTKSRTAWLATGLGLVLLAVYARSRGWRLGWKMPLIGVGVIVALFAGAIAVRGIDREVLDQAARAVQFRVEYWRSTVQMIGQYPLFGCGPGNFQQTYTAFKLPQASEAIADPHNFLLEVWSTAGTPALLALVALLVCFFWRLRTPATSLADAREGTKAPGEPVPSASATPPPSLAVVYAGAIAGVIVIFVGRWMIGDMMDPALLLVALPAGIACGALLHSWVMKGTLRTTTLVIAITVLLVNLLAQGGISYPGVATSVWVLMAVALNSAEGQKPPRIIARPAAGGIALLSGGLVMACYLTAYSPVLTESGLVGEALAEISRGRKEQADELLLAAAEADTWSDRPWRHRATLWLAIWRRSQKESDFLEFERSVEEYRRRTPRSSNVRFAIGHWYLIALHDRQQWRNARSVTNELLAGGAASNGGCLPLTAALAGAASREWQMRRSPRSEEKAFLDKALKAFREAAQRYPNSNFLQAQLAWTLHLTGQHEEAKRIAEEALRLDALNPHVLQKLADQHVIVGSEEKPEETAEQMMQRLRNWSG